jgi:hypothetical protein
VREGLFVSLKFTFSPMCVLAIGIEHAIDVRFSARMTPIRANIVGPPSVATRIKASIAACHSGAVCSDFGSLVI